MASSSDDLWKCPITLETFRDPVVAEDGQTYERSAITKWIIEGGTSPFTRQPLNVNALRPNYAIRNLVNEFKKNPQRNSDRFESNTRMPNLPPRTIPSAPVRRSQSEIYNREHELHDSFR